MPRYAVAGAGTNTASTTLLYFVNGGTAPARIKLSDLVIGSDATPADNAAEYAIRRITAENGTPGGTAVTPEPLDFNDRAANSNAVQDPTGEPTYAGTVPSGIYLMIGLNQRATFRWVAAPNGEFICDNADNNGFGLEVQSATATANSVSWHRVPPLSICYRFHSIVL